MKNLITPLIKIGCITMFSRILGFIRDILIAKMFGVGIFTDAFFVAFKLPNLLRRVFAEGAFYQVFLPILSEYQRRNNKEEMRIFISRVCGVLIFILIIMIFLGLFTASWIITVFVPGFDQNTEKFFITVLMFQIMFPYILFVSLSAMMGAVLNIWNYFLVPAWTPIILNISMIGSILCSRYVYFFNSIIILACSVIIGGLLQCIYYLPFLKKIDMLVIPKIKFFDDEVCRVYKAMGPAIFSVSSSQISLIFNIILVSFLQDGSVSWMYYADRLVELPIGVFGVTLTTILLTYLSRFFSDKNNTGYLYLMNWGIRLSFLLSIPSAIFLGMFSEPLIITLFQYGKFSKFDVLMTQYSVIAYSIGLPGLILVKVLMSCFHAFRDIKTSVRIVITTVIFTQFINLICFHLLKHVSFAFSISIGAWLNVGLLFLKLKRKYKFQMQSGWLYFCFQLFIASCVMCVVCMGLLKLVSDWSDGDIFYRFFRIICMLIISGSSYFLSLWYFGIRIKDFLFYIRR